MKWKSVLVRKEAKRLLNLNCMVGLFVVERPITVRMLKGRLVKWKKQIIF